MAAAATAAVESDAPFSVVVIDDCSTRLRRVGGTVGRMADDDADVDEELRSEAATGVAALEREADVVT